MRRFSFLLIFLIAACTKPQMLELTTRANPYPDLLPPMKAFSPTPARLKKAVSNRDLARDFLELAFEMESGRKLERLTRFEGPVTIALAEPGKARFEADLDELLTRIRREAGIDIQKITPGQPANIIVSTLSRRKLQATVPHAACFVVPRVSNWQEFLRSRRSGALDWGSLAKRERIAIFIPDDISPQETRDCLHEEIAQALGPLNDIYRLPDSVYNDDNIHTVLTAFDMLILKAFYDPAIRNGMSRDEVARVLPGILKRINPRGEAIPSDGIEKTSRAWVKEIESALGPRKSQSKRLESIERALRVAQNAGWNDNRLGFTYFARGRLALGLDSRVSAESFTRAYEIYSRLYGRDDIHTAHVALQLAAFAVSTGDFDTALGLVNDSLPATSRAQNATLLSTLLMVKAEALDGLGRNSEAATVRLDSLGWAQYGFSSEKQIRDRLREISSLRPRNRKAASQ